MNHRSIGLSGSLMMTAFAFALSSCGPVAPPTTPLGIAPAGLGGADGKAQSSEQCVVPKGETKPFVIEWEAPKRNEVRTFSQDGVLLVEHTGCGLRVLNGCELTDGRYVYVKNDSARNADSIEITNEHELKSRLPTAYFDLKGEFKKNDRWRLDYIFSDSLKATVAAVRRESLPSVCASATHYVSRIMLGAFTLAAEARREGGAGVGVKGVGLEADSARGASVIRHDGDFEKCVRPETPSDDIACKGIVQLYLTPIAGAPALPTTPTFVEGPVAAPGAGDWKPDTGNAAVVVSFDSTPAGAVVMLDGNLLCEDAPCSKAIPVGRHRISMQKEDYVSRDEIVTIEDADEIRWQLEKNFAELTVESTPSGLQVSIDGQIVGQTPLKQHRVAAGGHEVRVTSPCHHDGAERVIIKRGETRVVSIAPDPRLGAVKVTARDDRGNDLIAEVYIDADFIGKTPGTFPAPVCSKKLLARIDGRDSYNTELKIEEKQTVTIDALFSSAVRVDRKGLVEALGPSLEIARDLCLKHGQGTVTLQLSIGGNGEVETIKPIGVFEKNELGKCVTDVVLSATLPRYRLNYQTVVVPVPIFPPREGGEADGDGGAAAADTVVEGATGGAANGEAEGTLQLRKLNSFGMVLETGFFFLSGGEKGGVDVPSRLGSDSALFLRILGSPRGQVWTGAHQHGWKGGKDAQIPWRGRFGRGQEAGF